MPIGLNLQVLSYLGYIRDPNKDGAEGEARTRTGQPPLDPEPSASTNSATSARKYF